MSDLTTKGMARRRKVLGDVHVDRASATKTPLTAPFQDLITDAAWGHVWSRDTLSLRERSMLTLALLAAGGHWDEFAMHVRATKNTGASEDDIAELLLHVAIYAGVPAANHGLKVAQAELAGLNDD